MINFWDWHDGEVELEDEYFEAVYEREPSGLDKVFENRLLYFQGRETGTKISPEFNDVLE